MSAVLGATGIAVDRLHGIGARSLQRLDQRAHDLDRGRLVDILDDDCVRGGTAERPCAACQ